MVPPKSILMSDTPKVRTIVVVPYDPNWPPQFEAAAAALRPVFGDNLIELHHIGSTSVPGLAAKPTLDLLGVVNSLALVTETRSAFESLGFQARGAYGIEGREFFVKGAPNPTHHLHVYEVGHVEILKHLAFRDYLRAHPEAAVEYAALKSRLAALYKLDPVSYQDGKSDWIRRVVQQALEWAGYEVL